MQRTPLEVNELLIDYGVPIGEIRGLQTVGQTFLAPYDGLYRLEVSLADYGRLNTGEVVVRLKANPRSTESLAMATFHADEIRGDVIYSMEFDLITDSKGRQYYFQLEAPQAVPNNAITAYHRPHALYQEGTAFLGGQPIEGDLFFSLYFKVGFWNRANILLDQMSANKPSIWGDRRFYLGMGVAHLALLAALLWQVLQIHGVDPAGKS